jgi:astacin (peptidase family M12A)
MPDRDGDWLRQGDTFVWSPPDSSKRANRTRAAPSAPVALGSDFLTWPWVNGVIPYVVSETVSRAERVISAMRAWEHVTRVRFIELVPAQHPHYAEFKRGNGNSAVVGCRRKGRQPVWLRDDATPGEILHELGHVIGLWHEHCRADRDRYLDLVTENIDPAKRNDLFTLTPPEYILGEYDFSSIMHYALDACALVPGRPTMRPKHPLPPEVIPGSWNAISPSDAQRVGTLYSLPIA